MSRLSWDLDGRSYSCSNSFDWNPVLPRLELGMIGGGVSHSVNGCYDNSFIPPP